MSKWTAEQEEQLRELYTGNVPAKAISKLIGKSINAIYKKANALGLSDCERAQVITKSLDRKDPEAAYRDGRKRRQEGRHKSPPSLLPMVDRAWWLAGWHDADMELGSSVIAGRAA
ncbi:hypothetical protein [Modicisalibacter coralii]|uniref:hypothetical protein n=1 Tax=Modicisalibacter coralii TaxID=2304602 RepID=UPI00100AE84F|nr:hypothetical protein [Halomonas coralii]